MIKAFLDSKWYWYIPIISMYFLSQMSRWGFEPETVEERNYRSIIIDLTIPLHVFGIIFLLFYFKIF